MLPVMSAPSGFWKDEAMRFRRNARLDPSQVEDYRGSSGRRNAGMPLTLGGGGLIGAIVLVAFLLLGGGGGVGDLGALAGQTVGPGTASTDLQTECRTGADANDRDDCRDRGGGQQRSGVLGQDGCGTTSLRGRGSSRTASRLGCGQATSAVGPSTCPATGTSTSTSGSSRISSRSSAHEAALAEAYVLAHEYGAPRPEPDRRPPRREPRTGPQGGQVRLELQADCYAGLWVGHALETGLVEDITRQDVADALDERRRWATTESRGEPEGRRGRRVVDPRIVRAAQDVVHPGCRGIRRSCDTFRGRV